jgi:hypothetical protein
MKESQGVPYDMIAFNLILMSFFLLLFISAIGFSFYI